MFFKRSIKILKLHFGNRKFSKNLNNLKSNLNKLLINNMPRNDNRILEMQKQRNRIKEKSARYVPGIVSVQIIGSGACGAPASIYVFTDQTRYLFNCGEGTQRLAHEHKTKLSRLENIFLTRTSWDRIGGLPGLSLTVQDAGVPHLTLHGPPGLGELFTAMRRFVVLKNLHVEAPVCEANNYYEDSILTVNYIPISKEISNGNDDDNSRSNSPILLDDTNLFPNEVTDNEANLESSIPSTSTGKLKLENSVMAYVCRIKSRPGVLCLEKCVERGVPPGPLLGELKNGIDITLPNGNIVKANDVRGPDDPGLVFIVLDIPSIEYLDVLSEMNHEFEEYQSTAKSEENLANLVIHFTPAHIINLPKYRQFVDKFSPSTTHFVLNEMNKFSGYVAAHRIQWQLNQLNQHMFPILKETFNATDTSNGLKRIKLNDKAHKNLVIQNSNEDHIWTLVNSMTTYYLRPKRGLDRSLELLTQPDDYIRETTKIPGFTEVLMDLKETLCQEYNQLNVNRLESYPKIVFLGTGSCIPNKTRNVSSILVNLRQDSSILFDCGEGTTGQIQRFYGNDNILDIFRKIKTIYISHLHADHHIGLIGILQMRKRLLGTEKQPLVLLAPGQISSWLNFYDKYIEPINDEYVLYPNANFLNNNKPISKELLTSLGLHSIKTCLVKHCPHSFGIAIKIENKAKLFASTSSRHSSSNNKFVKITYSGDTMPTDDLIEIGKNSTILIHEATMEDELIGEARGKMHSTMSQAIAQGEKMNSKFTLLTHFSQRYAKLPRIEHTLASNIGIAFDNMEITELDLNYLNLLYPSLKLMFHEHCDILEQKALKRANKKQRQLDQCQQKNARQKVV